MSRCPIFRLNRPHRLAQNKKIVFISEKSCIKVFDDKKNKEQHFIEDLPLDVSALSDIEFRNGQEKTC